MAYRLVKRIQQSRRRIAQASILIGLPIWVSIFPAEVDSHPRSNASATYYHSSLVGRRMANGRPYNPHAMTAASNHYKLGTRVKVINQRNKKSVVVTITDRCGNCSIDLSKAAFGKIASYKQGRVPVNVSRF